MADQTTQSQPAPTTGFDVDGARKAGYSDAEILDHLAKSKNFDLDGARKAGYSDDELIHHLSGQSTPQAGLTDALTPRDTTGVQFPGETAGSDFGDLFSGIGASALQIPIGGYQLLRKVPGVDRLLPPPSPYVQNLTVPPDTMMGHTGEFMGDAGSFMLPGGLEEKAAQFINPASKAAKVLTRAGIDAASAGGMEAVKSGGDFDKTAGAAAGAGLMGGAMEGAGEPVIHALTDLWGKATGAGGEAIRTAATQASKDFMDAMRYKKTENQIVQDLNDAVHDVMTKRGNDYRQAMGALDQSIRLDSKPVQQALLDQAKAYQFKPLSGTGRPFSTSVIVNKTDQDAMKRAFRDVYSWSDYSPAGLDTLKQRLTSYADGVSPRAQPFFYRIADAANQELKGKVPGYADLTKNYADASELLQTVRKELSAGAANPGTTMRKLTYIFNQNSDFRRILLESLDKAAGSDLSNTLAGYSLRNWGARGLAGVAQGSLAALEPPNVKVMRTLAFGSPRVAGETMALLSRLRRSGLNRGLSLSAVTPAAINQLTPPPAALTPPPQ